MVLIEVYSKALENGDWKNRNEHQESRRRKRAFGLWVLGFITTFIPAAPCYDPEAFYEIFHCQVPLLVDCLSNFECLCVVYFLFKSSGTTYWDWIKCGVGVLGCAFSLLSSIGSLGSITNGLTYISAWYYGAAGFFLATIPRTYTILLAQKFWGWLKAQLGNLQPAQRENQL